MPVNAASLIRRACGWIALAIAAGSAALAWQSSDNPQWPQGNITLQLQLDNPAPSQPLTDGSTTWNSVVTAALTDWNSHLTITRFTSVLNSTAPANVDHTTSNGYNNVRWGSTIYGEAWGAAGGDVAGITLGWFSNDRMTESDVLFNTSAGMQWDSYRGTLKYQSNGQPINDLKRVALHEFGHVLGLDHPDQHGQTVAAIMNSVTSATDALTADDIAGGEHFYAAVLPPIVTQQPIAAQYVALGGTTQDIYVFVAGTPPFTYQWYRDNTPLSGGAFTGPDFYLSGLVRSSYGSYKCIVSNSAGSVTSDVSILAQPGSAPIFTTQPSSQTATVGDSVTFRVVAAGSPTPTLQWQKDGANLANGGRISGATSDTLTLTNLTSSDAGSYTAVATNSGGSVTSNAATLTVGAPANQGRIINMSVLTSIDANEEMTFGFYTGGSGTSGPKAILMRAMGPTLAAAPFKIAGALADPYIKFYNSTTLVAQDDDWSGDSPIGTAVSQVGAFPFVSTASKDAAILRTDVLADTGHSIKVSGVNGASGTVIAELYDATSASAFTATTPRLINVSLLKNVGNLTTLGFFVDGAPVKMLVRAVGPSLGNPPFNIPGTMSDPKMTVYPLGSSTVLASNDNWQGNAEVAAAVSATGAFPVPASSKDAALVLSVSAGGYSVQVTPSTGATGIAIIEVYEVP